MMMKKTNKNKEIVFNSVEEEMQYRMRDTEIDFKKLAKARISIALEDVFTPPADLPNYIREDSFNFLTGNSKYWKEARDFWCDLSEDYYGDNLRKYVLEKYATFNNKIPTDSLDEAIRIELQRNLPTYELLCGEIRNEFFKWLTKYNHARNEYTKYFSNSLLNIPFKYDFSIDIKTLMSLKQEYDEWFKELNISYKINPIIVKVQGKQKSLQKLYTKGADVCHQEISLN